MNRAGGVTECAFNILSELLRSLYGRTNVPYIIEGIEDPEYIDAVLRGFFYEFPYDIVRVMLIPDKVLSPQQHLEFCVRQRFLQFFESFPWILPEETHSSVECRAAPNLHRPETDLVHFLADRKHIFCFQSCCYM